MSLVLLKRLAIALGVLIVLWLGAEIFRNNPGDGLTEFDLLRVETSQVDSILVTRAVDNIALRKVRDSVWSVNGKRAATTAVMEFLDVLHEGTTGELVAQNPTSFPRFDIGDDAARRLRVFSGTSADVDLLVGKRGRDFQSVYVRWPGNDDVYVLRSQLGTMVDRPLNDWRDKTILDVPADSIAAIDVTRGGRSYSVSRADSGQWRLNGLPADSGAAVRLAGQFAALNGTGFPTPAQEDSVNLETPDRRVVLLGARSNVLAELVFDSTAASGYWVRRVGDSTVLRLDRFRVDQLTPPDSTLKPVR